MSEVGKYPQHDKLKNHSEDHSTICSFVEWLESHKEIGLAEWHEDRYYPISGRVKTESVIAEFFEIDYKAFQVEKEAMYQELRAAVEAKGKP